MSRPNFLEKPKLTRCVVRRRSQNSWAFVNDTKDKNEDLDFLRHGDVLESIAQPGSRLDSGIGVLFIVGGEMCWCCGSGYVKTNVVNVDT